MGTAIFLLLRSVDPLPLGELLQALLPFAGLSCILGAVPALTVGLARGLAAPARPGDLAR